MPDYRDFLDGLREEIKLTEANESDLRRQLVDVHNRLTEMRRVAASVANLVGGTPGAPTGLADAAEQAMRSAGEPLRAADLLARMADLGHPAAAAGRLRQTSLISAIIRRPLVFVKAGRGLWALKEWGLPVYRPGRIASKP